jgi:hypothetical protein
MEKLKFDDAYLIKLLKEEGLPSFSEEEKRFLIARAFGFSLPGNPTSCIINKENKKQKVWVSWENPEDATQEKSFFVVVTKEPFRV